MSLANKDVRKTLKEQFLCTWEDATDDPETGASFAHAPREKPAKVERGSGEHNVQILFVTPDGEIFHALAGYLGPKELLDEIAFAKKTFDAIQAPGIDRTQVLTLLQQTALKASPLPPTRGWAPPDPCRKAREFVIAHPLHPASDYRPSLIFGPGVPGFFGAGKSRHGLLGNNHTPPTVAVRPDDPTLEFLRAAELDWRKLAPTPPPVPSKAAASKKAEKKKVEDSAEGS